MTDPESALRSYLVAGDSLDEERLSEILDPGVVTHTPGGATILGMRSQLDTWRQAHQGLADLRHEPIAIIVDNDVVAARIEVTGVHTGTFLGIEPTGSHIRVDQALFARVSDGVITEMWEIVDTGAGFKQLGLLEDQPLGFEGT